MKTIKMKDSGIKWIGEIPENIQLKRIKFLVDYTKGQKPDVMNTDCIGMPYIGASEMAGTVPTNYTSDKIPICTPKDILVLWDGAKAGLIATNMNGAVASTVVKLTVKDEGVFPKYLFYLLKYGETYFKDKVNGTTIPHMSYDYIDDIPFISFDISVQQKIADFLDEKCADIDKLIANQQGQIEKLKEYKQAIITQAVTKGLNPSAPMKDSGVEWIGNIASNFQVYKIGSLFACRNEKVSDTEYPPLSVSKGGIVPQIGTVAKSDAIDNRKKVLVSDFVINSRSDRKQSCGLSKLNGSVSLINIVLKILRWDILSSDYTHYLLKNYCFAEEFYRWGHGIVADLWTTSWEEMKNISIPVPSIFEQQQIADYLDKKCSEIDKLISIKQAKIEKLNEYKKSLIYEYVTGKKEVV